MVVSLPPGTFAPYSDVKAALLFFERGKQQDEVLYQEVVLPEGLKKFSKGNPIDDVYFKEVRGIWQQMKAYLEGKGKQPEVTEFSWFEKREDLVKRGFDLSAKNPIIAEREKLPEPSVLLDRIIKNNEILHKNLLSLKHKLDEGVKWDD
ncbi:MAG: N-6 DNA methylase [Microcystaceae cyanobacterium]